MPETAAAACTNHLEREAIGVCIACRARICSECVTKVDGINYCVACLAGLEDGARRPRTAAAGGAGWWARLSALTLFALAVLLTWGLLEVALPGGL